MKKKLGLLLISTLILSSSTNSYAGWFSKKKKKANIKESSIYLDKMNQLNVPNNKEVFQELELEIENKIENIKSLLNQYSYGAALKEATNLRSNVRSKLFFDQRGTEEITIYVDSLKEADLRKIALNYVHGHFPEILNFYKRVEMLYTYTMVKRFSNGSSLNQYDKAHIQKTLTRVFNSYIKIKDKNSNENFIFESDFINDDHTYVFKRELFEYFSDLNLDSKDLYELADSKVKSLTKQNSIKYCIENINEKAKRNSSGTYNEKTRSAYHDVIFNFVPSKEQKDYLCQSLVNLEQVNCVFDLISKIKIDAYETAGRNSYEFKFFNPANGVFTEYNYIARNSRAYRGKKFTHLILDNKRLFDDHAHTIINACTN